MFSEIFQNIERLQNKNEKNQVPVNIERDYNIIATLVSITLFVFVLFSFSLDQHGFCRRDFQVYPHAIYSAIHLAWPLPRECADPGIRLDDGQGTSPVQKGTPTP